MKMPKPTLTLTPAERRIHALLLTSMTGKEIQAALKLRPSQYANWCKPVYTKLGARDRVDLMGQEVVRLGRLCVTTALTYR